MAQPKDMGTAKRKVGSDKTNTRHHYVPKMYLDGFADARGKLSVWTRADGKIYTTTPSNAAKIRSFYTFTDEGGNKSGALEDAFADIEDRAAVIIRNINTVFPPCLRGETKEVMAQYVALQYLRTPEKRKHIEQMMDLILKLEAMASINTRGDTSDVARQFLEDPHAIRIVSPKEGVLKYQFDNHPLITAMLMHRKWEVAVFNEPSLIVSDNPLLLIPDPEMPPVYGVGLATAKEIWFPLSSTRMIVMSRQDYREEDLISGTPLIANITNNNQVRSSYIEAYGHPELIEQLEGAALGGRPTFTVQGGFMKEFFDPYNQVPENPRPWTR